MLVKEGSVTNMLKYWIHATISAAGSLVLAYVLREEWYHLRLIDRVGAIIACVILALPIISVTFVEIFYAAKRDRS